MKDTQGRRYGGGDRRGDHGADGGTDLRGPGGTDWEPAPVTATPPVFRRSRASRAPARLAWLTALAVLGVGLLAGCGSGDEAHARKEFRFDGARLKVKSSNLTLRVIPYDGTEVTVDRWINGSGTRGPRAAWSLRGDTFSIALNCPGVSFHCEGRADVRVPRRLAVDVENANGSVRATGLRHSTRITSSHGDVTVSDLKGALTVRTSEAAVDVDRATGAVRLTTSDGTIRARHIEGPLYAHTSNAGVTAEDIAGAVDLRGSNGRMEATGLHGDAVAHTSNENLVLRFAEPPTRVEGGSTNGSVELRVPDDGTRYEVTGTNSNGDRTVRVPGSATATRRLDLTTSNGDVLAETTK